MKKLRFLLLVAAALTVCSLSAFAATETTSPSIQMPTCPNCSCQSPLCKERTENQPALCPHTCRQEHKCYLNQSENQKQHHRRGHGKWAKQNPNYFDGNCRRCF